MTGTGGPPSAAVGILAPLAARYGRWLGLDVEQVRADRDEAAEDIRAMQLVLRMERDSPPRWSDALAAACTAATAVCLDPRAAPGGEWRAAVAEYVAAHIRKVSRRARAGQWEALGDLPGLTVRHGTAEVRALLPGPVTDLDKRVSRLQVGGTDLPVDLAPGSGAAAVDGTLVLSVPDHPPMSAGKLMAQTGHAGMITAALLEVSAPGRLSGWLATGLPCVVHRLTPAAWRELTDRAVSAGPSAALVAVRDAGFTEIAPGTITVIADRTGLRG